MRTFGRELRKTREAAGLKVFELAGKIGVHPTYITHIEKNGKIPSPDVFEKIKNTVGQNPFLDELYKIETKPARTFRFKHISPTTEKIVAASVSTLVLRPKPVTRGEIESIIKAFNPDLLKDEDFVGKIESLISQSNRKYQSIHEDMYYAVAKLMKPKKKPTDSSTEKI